MIFLILCIIFSAAVLITFKFAERLNINSFSLILINYITAGIFGYFVANGDVKPLLDISTWNLMFMLMLGAWCILVFRLLAKSIQRAGVAVTTVASKMSVIVPVLFSIYIDKNDFLNNIKIIGIVLALLAVLLTIHKKNTLKYNYNKNSFYLPIFIFLGIGIIDASMKYAQITFVTNEMNSIFNASIFAVSGTIGLLLLPFNRTALLEMKHIKTWIIGACLGIVNFSSMFFMIAALNYVDANTGLPMHGSVIFGINNISVVLINVLVGLMLFKERLSYINWAGVFLSLLAIAILANGQ